MSLEMYCAVLFILGTFLIVFSYRVSRKYDEMSKTLRAVAILFYVLAFTAFSVFSVVGKELW